MSDQDKDRAKLVAKALKEALKRYEDPGLTRSMTKWHDQVAKADAFVDGAKWAFDKYFEDKGE